MRWGVPAAFGVAVLAAGCGATLGEVLERVPVRPARVAAPPPPHPALAAARDAKSASILDEALATKGRRIVISLHHRRLWLLDDGDTVLSAPVAVGKGTRLEWEDREWVFDTPRGRRTVIGKEPDPVWVPPDWHYLEIAVERKLEPVHLRRGQTVELSDGSRIAVRGDQVGRINQHGNFWPFTPGREIIFDDRIFIPPFGTEQRRIPRTLGTRKLDLGDGYLIHGTDQDDSIGTAASHGCVRMFNEDVERLYENVRVGLPVFIY